MLPQILNKKEMKIILNIDLVIKTSQRFVEVVHDSQRFDSRGIL